MTERLSLIIFGASGFTGKYAVEDLHNIAKKDNSITWAIAGRSHSKLEKILDDLRNKTGDDLKHVKIIIADVNDMDSLKEMTKQAKVIVNCCGPYIHYGEQVIKACIETQTSHVDISGETTFMEKMQLVYNEAAQKAGVYIVSACGLGSLPDDLGIIFLEQNFKGQLNSVECFVKVLDPNPNEPSLHYGTWEAFVYEISKQRELGPLRRQLYPKELPKMFPQLKSRPLIHKCKEEKIWCIPFLGPTTSVVYRSQRFLYENDNKRPIQLKPYIGYSTLLTTLIISLVGIFLFVMAQFEFSRKLLLKYPHLFSFGHVSYEGPSEEYMNSTNFSMLFCGEGWDDSEDPDTRPPTKKMKAKVSGINPIYKVTCTTMLYSAITIVKESDKMPGKGGVLTPGAAFSKTDLIKNLNENEVTFEIVN